MPETVITVSWMDERTEVYRDVSSYRVADGMLSITRPGEIGDPRLAPPRTVHLPLANIREWHTS